jgi:hypothetical protein
MEELVWLLAVQPRVVAPKRSYEFAKIEVDTRLKVA